MFHQARLLCMRLCAGEPAYPSYPCISDDGPPLGPAIIGSSEAGVRMIVSELRAFLTRVPTT
jgi:hypothetical protein